MHTNAVSTTKARQASEETILGRLLNVRLLTGMRKDEGVEKETDESGYQTQDDGKAASFDLASVIGSAEPDLVEEDHNTDGACEAGDPRSQPASPLAPIPSLNCATPAPR